MKLTDWQKEKAYKYVRYGDVELSPDSTFPTFLHFIVENVNHVFRRVGKGSYWWSCNTTLKNGYACIFKGNQEIPFCEHTLACHLFLEQLKKKRF